MEANIGLEHFYDIIVIGSGPSGEVVSFRLAKTGISVALVENELVGGECHFWACIPSKALLRPSEVLSEASEVEGAKQTVHGMPNVMSVLSRRDRFVDQWDDGREKEALEKAGVVIVRWPRTP